MKANKTYQFTHKIVTDSIDEAFTLARLEPIDVMPTCWQPSSSRYRWMVWGERTRTPTTA